MAESIDATNAAAPTARSRGALFVVVASLAFATSGPVARLARPAHPLLVACGRVAIASAVLFALSPRGVIDSLAAASRRQRLGMLVAGALLAAHFACFLIGLDRTSLPAAISLVSLEPLSVVLCAWALHAIPPTRLELVGVFGATLGAFVVARNAGTGEHRLSGDLLVILAVVIYGFYVSAARSFRGAMSPRSYAAIVYGAAAIALVMVLPFASSGGGVLWPLPLNAWLAIFGLALIPTIIGHTAVQGAAQSLSPSTVALVSPGETLGGLVIAAFVNHALPTPVERLGGAIVIAGATVAILGSRRRNKTPA